MTKTNGTKKRQSPSVERQMALSLVAVLEACEKEAMSMPVGEVVQAARDVLKMHGHESLESIPTRVRRIETEIGEALKAQDGAKLAQLGAALDRAKKGLPPLAVEKKAPQAPKTRKPRKKKDAAADPTKTDDDEAEWLTRHPKPRES